MTEQPKDGGAAFPRTVQSWNGNLTAFDGMSLRDWFAGQALAGLLGDAEQCQNILEALEFAGLDLPEAVAKAAYMNADAMIKAREATQ